MLFKASYRDTELSSENALEWVSRTAAALPVDAPAALAGRGIVICGGGLKYLTCAWVCINMLRRVGCTLPVELWHLGQDEVPPSASELFRPLGVTTVDASTVRNKRPARILNGWELKPYSILNCGFAEVLSLDADNVPIVDPTYLFDAPEYLSTGSIFWPDFGRLAPDREIWKLAGVDFRDEPEFESGQIVIDKRKCWQSLSLTMSLNEYSDFWYRYIHGDKETFHIAWRRLGQHYAMPERSIVALDGVMCQHDFQGRRVFQHRNLHKWTLDGNPRIRGFTREDECLAYLENLRPMVAQLVGVKLDDRASGEVLMPGGSALHESDPVGELLAGAWVYRRINHDERLMTFGGDGDVLVGKAGYEQSWRMFREDDRTILTLLTGEEPICRMTRGPDHVWRGRWLRFERMPVELVPVGLQEPSPSPSATDGPRLLTRVAPILADRFPGEFRGRFLVIGAGRRVWSPLTQDLVQTGWTGVLTEPLVDQYWHLEDQYAGAQGVRILNVAIADIEGSGIMWGRSSYAVEALTRELLGGVAPTEETTTGNSACYDEQPVRMRSLASLSERASPATYHLAIVDAARINGRVVPKLIKAVCRPAILIVADGRLSRCEHELRLAGYNPLYRDPAYQVWATGKDAVG